MRFYRVLHDPTNNTYVVFGDTGRRGEWAELPYTFPTLEEARAWARDTQRRQLAVR